MDEGTYGEAVPSLDEANRQVQRFKKGVLSSRIARVESDLRGASRAECRAFLRMQNINESLMGAALDLKRAASQINEVVHALGVLLSLPYILLDGEAVQALSLAAGNTGKPFDLETSLRVAEFKFIDWKGGSEVIRQNQLFKDFFFLAEANTPKQRYLYVLGDEYPLKFLNGGRALSSVMSKNSTLSAEFRNRYSARFSRVCEYYLCQKARVNVVDLRKLVPYFATGLNLSDLEDDH